MTPHVMFPASRRALASIPDLFDVIWPSKACYNFTKLAIDTMAQSGQDTSEIALQKAINVHGVHGAKFRLFLDPHYGAIYEKRLAELLLFSLFAVYEAWAADFAKEAQPTPGFLTEGSFQAPKNYSTTMSRKVPKALTTTMTDFSAAITNNNKCHISIIENYLRCYRYFKEVRNAIIHCNGLAQAHHVTAYNEFAGIATAANLKVKEVPHHFQVSLGSKVDLSLRGVVGFSEIVQRLIVSIDGDVSMRFSGDKAIDLILSDVAIAGKFREKFDRKISDRRLSEFIYHLGFPAPSSCVKVAAYIQSKV